MEEQKSGRADQEIEVVLRDLDVLLRQKLGDSLVVDSFTTRSLVSLGENYGSTMLRVDAEVRRDGMNSKPEKLSLVAKMTPPTEFQKMIFDSPVTFPKEIYMFTDIVPAYRALERESGIPDAKVFDPLPELFGSRLSLKEGKVEFDHDAVILMENLKEKNYACIDRTIGVDLAHARLVIKALARFHALGIALKFKKPQLFEELKTQAKSLKPAKEAEAGIVRFLITNVRKTPVLRPHLTRIEKALVSNEGSNLFQPPVEPWGTIVHTDLWVNNIMFRDHASGNPENLKFVDFQNYLYQNPLLDLVFFLFTSCTTDVRVAHIEDLVDFYYQTFISHLERLKCDVNLFSRDSFNQQLADAANLEFKHCAFMIRVIIMDSKTDPGMTVDRELFFDVEPTNEYNERLTELSCRFIKENWI